MLFNITGTVAEDMFLRYHSPGCLKFPLSNESYHDQHMPTYDNNASCSNGCFIVERVESFKYLGIILDFRMSWKDHTLYLKQYFNRVVRQLYHLSLYCNPTVLTLVYNGLFKSKLQYGMSSWGGTHFNKIEPLLIKQKHAIRIICRVNRRTPSFELFRSLKILPLRHLYIFKVLKIFFLKSGYTAARLYGSYNLRVNTRNFVMVPKINKALFSRFYNVTAHRLFNHLPDSLRCERKESTFLKNLRLWLFSFNNCEIENLFNPVI